MTTALADLAGLKARLGIPSTDTSRDTELTALLASANRMLLRLSRITLDDASITGEIHAGVREGSFVRTNVRPVDPDVPIVVEGRSSASSTWTTLAGDLEDSYDGRIRIIGSGDLIGFPPTYLRPRWSNWRRPRWDVIRLGYDAMAATTFEDLTGASIALAAYWSTEGITGSSGHTETVGQVTEQGGSGTPVLPYAVRAVLSEYTTTAYVAR